MLDKTRLIGWVAGSGYTRNSLYFGCDPELFITQAGKIVGAERVLPSNGLAVGYYGKVVLDGVQVEFNPRADPCRANIGNYIRDHFKTLKRHLDTLTKNGEEFEVSFLQVVDVPRGEFCALSDKSKALGCMPSLNKYNQRAGVRVNPSTYRKRSAGGHIHLGMSSNPTMMKKGVRERLVPILDILVGNTCVLIDREPRAHERRRLYGRAGEYRLPKHGLEYRTLSNFWLTHYYLMSFVMGLARMGVHVMETTGWDAEAHLLGMVDQKKIRRAINTNNLELAQENWVQVRRFIDEHVNLPECGLCSSNLDAFDYFCQKVWTEPAGLKYWFPIDPLTAWTTQPEGHQMGWEKYLNITVSRKMKASPDWRAAHPTLPSPQKTVTPLVEQCAPLTAATITTQPTNNTADTTNGTITNLITQMGEVL